MPLPTPQFENRSYRDLLSEALGRVPSHTPEWTHLGDADPGVTLLQLFAFLGESVGYRANLIPERNRQAFLRLLGVSLHPASAARSLVVFDSEAPVPLTLQDDLEVLAGKVPFRTTHGLDVLPVEGKLYYKSQLDAERSQEADLIYARLRDDVRADRRVYYETRTWETPESGVTLPAIELGRGDGAELPQTLDGALWLALLAPPRRDAGEIRGLLAGRFLSLGVMPALELDPDEGVVLRPGGAAAAADDELIFELPDLSSGEPRYRRLTARSSGAAATEPRRFDLQLPSAAELDVWRHDDPLDEGLGAFPPSLADTADADRLVTWIRIRLPQSDDRGVGLSRRLSWIGLNAAEVVQRARVRGEVLPEGTGEPDQSMTLANTPVLSGTLELRVAGEVWRRIDALSAAGPEVPPRNGGAKAGGAQTEERDSRVFTLDRESGEIRFGDGLRGRRPRRGDVILASYAYGGGRRGNVGIGAISKSPLLPDGLEVRNPVPAWRGDEAETVADAERLIPQRLRHRDRLIAADDWRAILERTPGVDLGRVEVLPLYHPDPVLAGTPTEGAVTVLVIPRHDPAQPEAPRPDRLFLDAVHRHLEPRRLITTEVHVRGPQYVDLWVSLGLEVVPGRDAAPVLEAARAAVRRFLSPIAGGFEGGGWPLGTAVEPAELAAAATRVDGVARSATVRLGGATGGELPGALTLTGLQLPRLAGLAVDLGDAVPIEALRDGEAPEESDFDVVPIPVVPETC